MRGLADQTDRTDHASERMQADRVGVGLSGSTALPERVAVHRELVVTEGRKAVIVPPLQGQDHLDRLIIRLRLNVLESFGVAPQFVGERFRRAGREQRAEHLKGEESKCARFFWGDGVGDHIIFIPTRASFSHGL